MIDNEVEQKFLLDAQRYAFRESVKWAWFGYCAKDRQSESVEKLAAQFIEDFGLKTRFSVACLRKYYYELSEDFKILKKC